MKNHPFCHKMASVSSSPSIQTRSKQNKANEHSGSSANSGSISSSSKNNNKRRKDETSENQDHNLYERSSNDSFESTKSDDDGSTSRANCLKFASELNQFNLYVKTPIIHLKRSIKLLNFKLQKF